MTPKSYFFPFLAILASKVAEEKWLLSFSQWVWTRRRSRGHLQPERAWQGRAMNPVCPPKVHMLQPTPPQVMVLGGGAFGGGD